MCAAQLRASLGPNRVNNGCPKHLRSGVSFASMNRRSLRRRVGRIRARTRPEQVQQTCVTKVVATRSASRENLRGTREARSSAFIQSFYARFRALLVFLKCCAPGHTDRAHLWALRVIGRPPGPALTGRPAPATRHTDWRSKTSSSSPLSPLDFLEAAAPMAFPIAPAADSKKAPSIRWKARRCPPWSHTLTAIFVFML